MSAADKLLAALGLFTEERSEWTVEDAAKELKLGVSTTYRYFKSLSDAGLIVAFATGRYVLGPAITQMDRQTRLLDPLIAAAKPIVRSMLDRLESDAIVLLCRLYRRQVMCVHQEVRGFHDFASSYERGKLMQLHRGAASKIVLAHLSARIVRAFHEEHAQDMAAVSLGTSWLEVKRSLHKLRSAGIAITHGELDRGVLGISAPLFKPDGSVIGSVAVVLRDDDVSEDLLAFASRLVKETASSTTIALAAAIAEREARLE
jgi:DNA-binding IclR family transcriptional regulator